MICTVFETDWVTAPDRVAVINEGLGSNPSPMELLSPRPEALDASVRELQLGPVSVTELTCSTAEIRRTARLIRAGDPGFCSIVLSLQGEVAISHRGRSAELRPGELVLGDSSHPFAMRLGDDAKIISAQLPASLLSLGPAQLDRALPLRLGSGGLGGLLAHALLSSVTDAGCQGPADASRLGSIVVDLVSAVLARRLEAGRGVPDDAYQRTLVLQIESFIERQLGNPDLSPRTIAVHHHISVSHLHRLFRARGTTVARSIRQRRLERARRDLSDPALHGVPIHRIATRWGFADHATFTRAFTSLYDSSPSEHRHRPLDGRDRCQPIGIRPDHDDG